MADEQTTPGYEEKIDLRADTADAAIARGDDLDELRLRTTDPAYAASLADDVPYADPLPKPQPTMDDDDAPKAKAKASVEDKAQKKS